MKQHAICMTILVGLLFPSWSACADEDILTIDVCPSTRAHFRNDWSLIFPLKQGRLMLAWCEYYATSPEQVLHERKSNYLDAAACRISARISTDQGRTWSETFTLKDNTARLNVKHPNLLRLASEPGKSKGSGLFSPQHHSAATVVISWIFISLVIPTCCPCPEVVSRPGEDAPFPSAMPKRSCPHLVGHLDHCPTTSAKPLKSKRTSSSSRSLVWRKKAKSSACGWRCSPR